ncbi:MAG: PDZ domain-containing protein [Muribaculaceae bacterium]|nr:PDZ domain-containing protein [Muribaculaceae bacterium]
MKKLIALCCLIASYHIVFAELPEKAIRFILDSHVYIQGVVADTIPISLIYDTGADRLYLDKDYMELSSLGKQPYRKAKARMGGAGNEGPQTVPIIIDTIPLKMGNVYYMEHITPIVNLREIIGRHTDGMIGNNAMFDKPLLVNYSNGYLLSADNLTPSMLEGYTKLPAKFNDNRIDIECELKIDSLQTVKGTFRLDMGCGSTIILTNATRKSLDLTGKPQAKCYYSNMGVGGDGTDVSFRAASFKFLDELHNVVVAASYNTEGSLSDRAHRGIIGNDILCHYDLIIDAPNNTLYARRNSNADNSYQKSSKIQMGYLDRTDIGDGWIVSSIYEGGIAENGGFEIGDIILSINGRPVKEISWEEQRKGLGLNGRTIYEVKKKNGDIVSYVLDIDKEIL